jgi:transcriptional regulator with XRE-family HTH domain
MFSETVIRKLKQNNISVDAEKTQQRVVKLWKSASRSDQTAILTATGVKRSTVQRAYRTGNISAKLVVPLAQTLNVDPYYLTGQADEPGKCTEDRLKALLSAHGYAQLLAEYAKETQKLSRRTKPQESDVESFDDEDTVSAGESSGKSEPDNGLALTSIDAETWSFIAGLTEDELILLVKSILLRAKSGGKNAELATKLKLLLIS